MKLEQSYSERERSLKHFDGGYGKMGYHILTNFLSTRSLDRFFL